MTYKIVPYFHLNSAQVHHLSVPTFGFGGFKKTGLEKE